MLRPLERIVDLLDPELNQIHNMDLEEARRRGLLTCALTGYDGGRLAELDWLDHLLIARSDYIPRLQEAHATMYHLLLEAVGSPR